MTTYRATFSVSAEITVDLDAADEDEAADRAWELAQEHLQVVAVTSAQGVTVMADLDGVGADEVTER